MAVTDLWHYKNRQPCTLCRAKTAGTPTTRHGKGLRWRVVVGDHPTRYFATKTDAETWETHLKSKPIMAGSETVTILVGLWLAGKQGLSPRAVKACTGDAAHVRARWGTLAASDLRRHEIQAWLAGLTVQVVRGEWVDDEPGGQVWVSQPVTKPASEALRRRLLQCLAGALQIAVEQGHLERNPCDGVRIPKDHRREAHFLTVAEVTGLADAAGKYRALVWLLAATGLRIGEAAALRVGDVDAARGRLRVTRAKGMRGRDVPVPATVLAMLPLTDRDVGELLFTNRDGGPVDVDHWRSRVWRRALRDTGLTGVRIHDLRHTAASWAIAAGADVKAVQSMLGHASATLTLDTYGHLLDSRLDEVAGRIDATLTADSS